MRWEERGMAERTTAAVWVKGIAEMLSAEGLDVSALFAATGIDAAALDAPGARLQTERISQLWELAVKRSGNPALALAQHQVARPASFDVVGYTMMSCADLRAAFERLIRYMLILSDALTMTMSEEAGGDRITFVLFGGDRPIPRQRIEFISVSVISFCRWISRRERSMMPNIDPVA
jgi:Arabinose-binding domain of AraC transcription regulator, N-term